MARSYTKVNIGTNPNDGTGDEARTAFANVNTALDEIATDVDGINTGLTQAEADITTLDSRITTVESSFQGSAPYIGTYQTALLPTTAIGIGSIAIASDAIGLHEVGNQLVQWTGSKWVLLDAYGIEATTNPISFIRHLPYCSTNIVRCMEMLPNNYELVKSGSSPGYSTNGSRTDLLARHFPVGASAHEVVYQAGAYGSWHYGLSSIWYCKFAIEPVSYVAEGEWSLLVGNVRQAREAYFWPDNNHFAVIESLVSGELLTSVQKHDGTSWTTVVDNSTWMSVVGHHIMDTNGEHVIEMYYDGSTIYIEAEGQSIYSESVSISKPLHIMGQLMVTAPTAANVEFMIGVKKEAWYLA